MGARKRNKADEIKEAKKKQYFARLNNCPTSPRKMRLVADLVRGVEVEKALNVLKYTRKVSAGYLEKLLRSAIANWQAKNEGGRIEDANLVISQISVDGGRSLKRIRPAPQGRAYRIAKRSNHVTMVLDTRKQEVTTEEEKD